MYLEKNCGTPGHTRKENEPLKTYLEYFKHCWWFVGVDRWLCLPGMYEPWVPRLQAHTCGPNAREVEARGPEAQGPP